MIVDDESMPVPDPVMPVFVAVRFGPLGAIMTVLVMLVMHVLMAVMLRFMRML